jgi:hypothetical protein
VQAQLDATSYGMDTTTFIDDNGLLPSRLVNAGRRTYADFPDLLGIAGNESNGYYLDYFPSGAVPGGYGMVYGLPAQTTPTGGTDWNTWES